MAKELLHVLVGWRSLVGALRQIESLDGFFRHISGILVVLTTKAAVGRGLELFHHVGQVIVDRHTGVLHVLGYQELFANGKGVLGPQGVALRRHGPSRHKGGHSRVLDAGQRVVDVGPTAAVPVQGILQGKDATRVERVFGTTQGWCSRLGCFRGTTGTGQVPIDGILPHITGSGQTRTAVLGSNQIGPGGRPIRPTPFLNQTPEMQKEGGRDCATELVEVLAQIVVGNA